MATEFDALCSPRRKDQRPPHAIERHLGHLIRSYLRTRSPVVASAIADHIETLLAHPCYGGDVSQRCTYLHLRLLWRWLAEPVLSGVRI